MNMKGFLRTLADSLSQIPIFHLMVIRMLCNQKCVFKVLVTYESFKALLWYSISFLFTLGDKSFQDDFKHNFALSADEADGSVVLAELEVTLCWESNILRARPNLFMSIYVVLKICVSVELGLTSRYRIEYHKKNFFFTW